ncbi:acyl carrier protein [Aminobacter sp. P9b]|uniref:Acyl carrier protein n=1 Tax=Aminobacter niigataensis TaxID=83265 RepID=A0ABR6KVX1_9HYPH|nr:acyl carrier protein [Aminobacter niigataensis]MBB4648671.1 acyl carrier protein [Aminobacter niigataensis]
MTEDVRLVCVEMFRDIAGLNSSSHGGGISDAQILSNPIESFDVDSLTTMEYVMGLEERFDVVLDEEAVNGCANVGELAALISTARV